MPQLAYEIFPHVKSYAAREKLFNIFDCLDKGSWEEFAVNHVTQALLVQAGLCEDKNQLTILTDEPVEVVVVKEEWLCSDCKKEITKEEFEDDACPRGDCPKNMLAAIKKAQEEEAKKKAGPDVVPVVRVGTFASETVQKYYSNKKKAFYKSGYTTGVWKRKEIGPFNYDEHKPEDDGVEIKKKPRIVLTNRAKEEYEGFWNEAGQRHGQGVEINNFGQLYEGFYKEDKKHYYGRQMYHHGGYYVGEF